MDFEKNLIEKLKSSIVFDLLNETSISVIVEGKSKIQLGSVGDIAINIVCNSNSIIKYSIHYGENYLLNSLDEVNEECSRRGLEFSVDEMRLEIIDDLKTLEVSNLATDAIVEFTNTILFFHYVIKYVLKNLKLPRSMWYSKDEDYKLFYEKYKIHPIAAGSIDGYIDEIITIDKALFGIYSIFFINGMHEKMIETFKNSTGFIDMMNEEELDVKFLNEELRMHKSVQTMISVSFLLQGDELLGL